MPGLERQAHALSVLSSVPADTIKTFADDVLGELEALGLAVEVLENRTGLVMLPAQDNAQGTNFFLGEVLISEARVRVDGALGYGACLGRDLEQALAIGILETFVRVLDDGAGHAELALTQRVRDFIAAQTEVQREQDQHLMRRVEATRVQMETF